MRSSPCDGHHDQSCFHPELSFLIRLLKMIKILNLNNDSIFGVWGPHLSNCRADEEQDSGCPHLGHSVPPNCVLLQLQLATGHQAAALLSCLALLLLRSCLPTNYLIPPSSQLVISSNRLVRSVKWSTATNLSVGGDVGGWS